MFNQHISRIQFLVTHFETVLMVLYRLVSQIEKKQAIFVKNFSTYIGAYKVFEKTMEHGRVRGKKSAKNCQLTF